MTDPRIEAVARALCLQDGHDPDGNDSYIQSGMGANWCAFKDNARAALAVADAVYPLLRGVSIPELPTNVPIGRRGKDG
ncbi:hypothetical protein K2X14_11395 [Acetobacter sp. TBRC 12305]|uniref:Uncharacterized protein n=1 Tax=Acetobacter garciniae TaxID=2817435 RepID=A0A939HN97_9PROT|nr:hypothetical protein [Acetobacter garciniae]MBO1325386.1 hypothetical protein [Acetobacter garciniae]MBX0345442.1 hypothetical protein [Acetobacter garciniae]